MTLPPGWLFTEFRNEDCLDALVVVPAIAQATSRIKIGFNSVLLPILPPYQWAKYLSTLDVMSDGRLIVGAAMGWWEEDFASLQVNRKKRGKLFDEQLELVTALWTQERVTFHGEHYSLHNMPLQPKPIQKPYPPVWIGGGPMSVWRAARYGECLLVFWPDEDAVRNTWCPKLAEEGARYGTDPRLAAFTFVYVATALSIGILISSCVKTQQVAMMLAMVTTMLPSVMLSGFIFALKNMPTVLQAISYIIPARYYIIVVRGIMLKGAGLIELAVQGGFLIVLMVVFLVIAMKRFTVRIA